MVTVETVKADIGDVRWAILKRVARLKDLLPASAVVLVEDVVLLLRRKIGHRCRGSGLVRASGLLERLNGNMLGRVIENAQAVIVEVGRRSCK